MKGSGKIRGSHAPPRLRMMPPVGFPSGWPPAPLGVHPGASHRIDGLPRRPRSPCFPSTADCANSRRKAHLAAACMAFHGCRAGGPPPLIQETRPDRPNFGHDGGAVQRAHGTPPPLSRQPFNHRGRLRPPAGSSRGCGGGWNWRGWRPGASPPAQCGQTREPESKQIGPQSTSANACSAVRIGLSDPLGRDKYRSHFTGAIGATCMNSGGGFSHRCKEHKKEDPCDYGLLTGIHGLPQEELQHVDLVLLSADHRTGSHKIVHIRS